MIRRGTNFPYQTAYNGGGARFQGIARRAATRIQSRIRGTLARRRVRRINVVRMAGNRTGRRDVYRKISRYL